MGLPTFATLVNQQIVLPTQSANHYGVDRHFFQECMADTLRSVPVDESWYLEAYPDIRVALQNGVVPDCKSHFLRFGYYEHRMPYKIVVDEKWYRAAYPDISRAIELGTFKSGQEHFEQWGYREGRLPFENFSLG